jgi:glycosyltransferase involved in cell wall biosynthesis
MLDVLIQTHNEQLNLPNTLASLKGWVNRVFVVDSGSSDRTREIAEAFGAVFVHHDWEGYAAQKNWALDNLPFESSWILILDADEACSPELIEEIKAIVSKPAETVPESAFHINRVLLFMGKPIRHCGYFPSWNLRLFKRGHARYEQRLVHEHMIVTGKTGYLRHLLLHEDRRGLEHFIAKHNRYSTLEAHEIYAAREEWPGLHIFLTDRVQRRRYLKNRVLPFMPLPWVLRFVYMYIVKLGFLDGRAGWYLCLFISSYEFFIRMKYTELVDLQGRQQTGVGGLSVAEGSMGSLKATAGSLPAPLPTHGNNEAAVAAGNTAGAQPLTLLPVARTALPVVPPVTPPGGSTVVAADAPGRPSISHGAVVEPTGPARVPTAGKRAPVSVMIPTLNESKNLARCLDHLRWADEVVVVDSGSKDETCQIAHDYGAVVVNFKWSGKWPKKKNWALQNVPFRNEWVLIVDADEWITPELADEISRMVREPKCVGYYVNRRFIFMGGWIKHCGYYPSWNLRLIRRGYGEYEQLTEVGDTGSGDNEVHEHIAARGPVGHLNNDMLHFAFPSIHLFMEKHNRYSNWEAAVQFRGAEAEGKVAGSTELTRRRKLKNLSRRLPFRPTLRFLYSYIWQGGFLDGKPGYVFCRLLAIYEYLSVAKYYELRRAEDDIRKSRQMSSVPALAPPTPTPENNR